jgi:hypothetical protein
LAFDRGLWTYVATAATRFANSGLGLSTRSSRIVKSAGCKASLRKNPRTDLSTLWALRLNHVEHKGRRTALDQLATIDFSFAVSVL